MFTKIESGFLNFRRRLRNHFRRENHTGPDDHDRVIHVRDLEVGWLNGCSLVPCKRDDRQDWCKQGEYKLVSCKLVAKQQLAFAKSEHQG